MYGARRILWGQLLVGILLLGFLGFSSALAVERSWENKTEQENTGWKAELKSWGQVNDAWFEKREALLDKYYGDSDQGEKYCNTNGCYEEGLLSLTYETPDKSQYWEFNSTGSLDIEIKKALTFSVINSGQTVTLETIGNEYWESRNSGQKIKYVDKEGNVWESYNTGQSLIFKGVDGSSWESRNSGMSLELRDAEGHTWESRNSGQSVDNDGNVSNDMGAIFKDDESFLEDEDVMDMGMDEDMDFSDLDTDF